MSPRPNFLWILLDDVSPTLPAYGVEGLETPNFDRIAEEGCVYENAFATGGVCPTARNSLITGRYHTSNGAHHARTLLGDFEHPTGVVPYTACPPPQVKAFTEILRAAGYFCTNNSKTDYQIGAPSSVWDISGSSAHWGQRGADQPFFSVFNPLNTNESRLWPENAALDDQSEIPVEVPPFLPDTPKVRASLSADYKHIEAADGLLGKLLSKLEWEGLLEDTIVFVLSDHGMGFPRYKRTLYDTGLKIPLLVRAPEYLKSGVREERLVSGIDLGPTVLSLAGPNIPDCMHGKPFFGPASSEPREVVFAAQDRIEEVYDQVRMARDDRYKLIVNGFPQLGNLSTVAVANNHPVAREIRKLEAYDLLVGAQKLFAQPNRARIELYDIEADPWELNNLAGDPEHVDTLRRLLDQLESWQRDHDPWKDIPEAEMLSQWWFEGDEPQTDPPVAKVLGYEAAGLQPIEQESEWEGPVGVVLECPTQRASIEYQLLPETGTKFWKLYAGKIPLKAGQFILRARSARYGYQPNPEVAWKVHVHKPFASR